MIFNNVLEAIGHTPMVKLNRMNKKGNADIYVKFEGLNVGGSIKTRTAYNMILQAEKEGKIKEEAYFCCSNEIKVPGPAPGTSYFVRLFLTGP